MGPNLIESLGCLRRPIDALISSHILRVPGEIKRREVEWDPQVSPEEIMSREVELGCKSWTSFALGCYSTAVQRTLSLWLCPARQLKQQLRSTLAAAQWWGDTSLTLPLFWWRPMASPVFFGWYPQSSLYSLILFALLSPSLISNLASIICKENVSFHTHKHISTHAQLHACICPHYKYYKYMHYWWWVGIKEKKD